MVERAVPPLQTLNLPLFLLRLHSKVLNQLAILHINLLLKKRSLHFQYPVVPSQ